MGKKRTMRLAALFASLLAVFALALCPRAALAEAVTGKIGEGGTTYSLEDCVFTITGGTFDWQALRNVLRDKFEVGQSMNYKGIDEIVFADDPVATGDASGVFSFITSLKSVSGAIDTSGTTNMNGMFIWCSNLESVDTSTWSTPKVEIMADMFNGCSSLVSLDLTMFDTQNVREMNKMFYGCSSLEILDLSSFDTSNTHNMDSMFQGCGSLAELNVSNFIVKEGISAYDVFSGCASLVKVTVGDGWRSSEEMWSGASWKDGSFWKLTDGTTLSVAEFTAGTSVAAGTWTRVEPVTMYRLYNPNSGEHFYTASEEERDVDVAKGWSYEGEAWIAPSVSDTPVYRMYSGTDHHYTTSEAERDALVDAGWTCEGIGWYSDDAKGVALLRVFNPNVQPTAEFNNSGSHHYTVSEAERDNLVGLGWRNEGIAWYGMEIVANEAA